MSVYMRNKTLVTIKNQLVLKAEKLKSMFAMDYVTNCFVFVFFYIKNETNTHTRNAYWVSWGEMYNFIMT